jgi:uncharacterized protein (TIGR03067 family)
MAGAEIRKPEEVSIRVHGYACLCCPAVSPGVNRFRLRRTSSMLLNVVPAVACFFALCVEQEKEKSPMNDHERIQGVWMLVSGQRHGTPFPDEVTKNVKLVFSKDAMTTINRGRETRVSFTLDAEKAPKEIDVDMDGAKGLGIYALEGDELKILHGEVGDERPKRFDTEDLSRFTLLILNREKR